MSYLDHVSDVLDFIIEGIWFVLGILLRWGIVALFMVGGWLSFLGRSI